MILPPCGAGLLPVNVQGAVPALGQGTFPRGVQPKSFDPAPELRPSRRRAGRCMSAASDNDQRRTSALAWWRYAHDNLRAARMLCRRHRLRNTEAQAHYHLVAQSIEFALKAHLRASGVPDEVVAAIVAIAPHHREREFLHVLHEPGAFPDLDSAFHAVHWMLDASAPLVALDYTLHFAHDGSPTTDAFVRRLRADLAATAHELLPLD
jgi:hypothetical protein